MGKYLGPDDSWYEPKCEEPEVEVDKDLMFDLMQDQEDAQEEYYFMMLG